MDGSVSYSAARYVGEAERGRANPGTEGEGHGNGSFYGGGLGAFGRKKRSDEELDFRTFIDCKNNNFYSFSSQAARPSAADAGAVLWVLLATPCVLPESPRRLQALPPSGAQHDL